MYLSIEKHAITQQVRRYLTQHPEEQGRLAHLMAQLALPGESIFERSTMAGHLTSSIVVLDAAYDKVLLIHHKAYDRWLAPGGHYEGPGSLWESGCREVAEETGLATLTPWYAAGTHEPLLLDIDTHAIAPRPSKNEGAHWHHDFAFLAVAPEPFEPVAQESEVLGVAWVPLSEMDSSTDPCDRRLARKVQALLAAARRAQEA